VNPDSDGELQQEAEVMNKVQELSDHEQNEEIDDNK